MAVFFSENAFDVNDLDFNAPFRTTHTGTIIPGTTIPLALPDLTGFGLTISLPAHSFTFDSAVKETWAGNNVEAVAGHDLTFDLGGNLTGGVASMLLNSTAGLANYLVVGFSMDIMDVYAAGNTASNTDDIALFQQIFSGNDLITLSLNNDVFDAGSGDDLVVDQRGNDSISGGLGNDVILAAKGNDRVDGGAGNDVVLGGGGDDHLKGGLGRDYLWAGTGSDTVSGGQGHDFFLFKAGDGAAVITDFNAAEDQLVFMGPASGLANLHFAQVGANTRVTFSDVVVILDNVDRHTVSVADVETGGNAQLGAAVQAILGGWDYIA